MRPSPERLELQVRALTAGQEQLLSTITEDRLAAVDASKHLSDSLTSLIDKKFVEFTDTMTGLMKDVCHDLANLKVAQVCLSVCNARCHRIQRVPFSL